MAKKALLVDDEGPALETLVRAVDWASLGYEAPALAHSAAEARRILHESCPDLVICDIEMPQENGLELLAWVRATYPAVETIFLTCHAEFDYARQAIQLGSFDYLLKPLKPGELQAVLQRLGEKVDRDREAARYGGYWLKSQPLIFERFWIDVVTDHIPPVGEEIYRAALERHLALPQSLAILPVLFRSHEGTEALGLRDRREREFQLRSMILDRLLEAGSRGWVIRVEKASFLAIVGVEVPRRELWSTCEAIVEAYGETQGAELACYLGDPCPPEALQESYRRLQALADDNVAGLRRLVDLHRLPRLATTLPTIDVSAWAALLAAGEGRAVADLAKAYLARWEASLDAAQLDLFYQDFLQMIHETLKDCRIPGREIFGSDLSREPQNLDEMRSLVVGLTGKVEEAIKAQRNEDGPGALARAKAYLADHLDDDIKRDDVAREVHVSPDHLTRLFKKDTGLSFSAYFVRERLARARFLLAESDLPVGRIASQAGYTSFSHFSRIFKEAFGYSPLEYRRRQQEKKP